MQRIKEVADDIRDKIKGGTLYGQSVDMLDADMVLVAAYFLSRYNCGAVVEKYLFPAFKIKKD